MTKAIILAAGEGTRLRPYTLDRPKCLVEIFGRPLLSYQLEVLDNHHIAPKVLVAGYLAEQLDQLDLRVYINKRYAETNMLWTLFCAETELTEDVIISYGDIVYSNEVLQKLLESPYEISVIVDSDWEKYWRERFDNPLDDAETLKIGEDGNISEIGQAPKKIDEIHGQYIGLMKFSRRGIGFLKKVFYEAKSTGKVGTKNIEKAYMTDILQVMIQSGYEIKPIFIENDWIEIDTVTDLKLKVTEQRLKNILSKNAI
jgi:L-glutamine-phosphate cytidylyltransferase